MFSMTTVMEVTKVIFKEPIDVQFASDMVRSILIRHVFMSI